MQCSPQALQHSGPACLQYQHFFDVATKMIYVVTNSVQTMPIRYALNLDMHPSHKVFYNLAVFPSPVDD